MPRNKRYSQKETKLQLLAIFAIALLVASIYITVKLVKSGKSTEATPSSAQVYRPNWKVFITSETYNGNLGGLSGADSKCQSLATTAKLTGTYRAWLSTSTVDAKDRITDGVYKLVDGVTVANSKTDLLDGSLQNKLYKTEKGAVLPSYTWTGTKSNGTKQSDHCNNWTSTASSYMGYLGQSSYTDGRWTAWPTKQWCNNYRRLYCFQVQ